MNCAALNESRIESLIFGHVEGAFEGAVSDAEGYLQAADRSTLFLDEIGELNLAGQACLLRFLESGESQKVGSSEVEHFDVRILAATHQNLQQLVNEGSFREDLFYRLNVVTLELPPLRQRTSDIPDLLRHFTMAYALEQNKSALQFDRSAMRRLQQHDWPGNVRQLRNLAARLVTLKPDNSILNADDIANELAVQSSSLDSSVYELPAEGIRLEEIEIDLIKQALNKTGGNKSQAARLLGISRDAFLYRLKKHQLDA